MSDDTALLTPGHLPSPREIEEVIITLLASEQSVDPGALIEKMRATGPALEVDSLLIVEVLARIESTFGVTLPATAMTASVMRSVSELARHLRELLLEANAGDQT